MTATLLLCTLLATAGARDPAASRLQAAQQQFNLGEFHAALALLERAAEEARDAGTASRIQLLRGQAHGALRDLRRAEVAFTRALEHDPEAALDPERVDPALVQLLESVRQRLSGELRVRAGPGGDLVFLDGEPLGAAPVTTVVRAGRYTVEVRSADGRRRASERVVVRPGRVTEASLTPVEPRGPHALPAPDPGTEGMVDLRPVADVRLALDPSRLPEGPGIELGGGLDGELLRASLHVQLFPFLGLALRGALAVPLTPAVRGYASVELPLHFIDQVAPGVGGAAGVEHEASPWVVPFAEVGARHLFTPEPRTGLLFQGGVRLRLP